MDFVQVFLNHQGEISALLAAFLWAIASLIFDQAGKKINSLELTLWKGFFAIFFLGGTILIQKEAFSALTSMDLILLVLSSLAGIGMGDTAFFKSMEYLSVGKALLLGTLAPPMTALIAFLFLGENLPLISWLGILVTVAGVAWVITERRGVSLSAGNSENLKAGLFFGFLSALGQSIGAILSRIVFNHSEIGALQATFIRVFAGMILMLVWMWVIRYKPGTWIKAPGAKRLWAQVLSATFLGAYLATWLQQASFKFSMVGIAQTLSTTSPLFALPIGAVLGEKVSLRSILGVLLAIGGIWLLFR